MKTIIIHILVIFYIIVPTIKCEEQQYENIVVCDKCRCQNLTDSLTLDCQNQNFHRQFANWPPHSKKLVATFTNNNYTTLERLPPSDAVIELILNHCHIRFISRGVFESVKNLKILDLSYNYLTSEEVSADKLKGPYNNTISEPLALEYLNLAYNQIHSLNKNLFEHTPNLQELNLEGNHFSVLDAQTQLAISKIKNLKVLNLAYNSLTELVDGALNNLKYLYKINLSGNELDFVPKSLVQVAETLQDLNVSNNPIIEFEDDTFLGIPNLIRITANNLTKLESIKSNTFLPLIHLKTLSLNDNRLLSQIQREAFGPNQTLEELYINNNHLETIDDKLLNWSNLKVFEFNDNPLDCSCELYNITLALPKQITKNKNGPICYDKLKGFSVAIYELDNKFCGPRRYRGDIGHFATQHYTVMRISFVSLSIALLVAVFVAASLGYTRFRRFQRNNNYPFATQVMYNPLSQSGKF